jgi:hypothetical protein
MCLHNARKERKEIADLSAARLDYRQSGFDGAAMLVALSSERKLSPNHWIAQGVLRSVVGRFSTSVM